jgi:hypothetical protein
VVQTGVAFGPLGHTFPQLPQFAASVGVFVSQPFAASPSQFAKPGLHVRPQVPDVQVAVACAPVMQAVVQPPQWFTSL